ncbi:MAG: histidine phosphatase family protein [Anaerolineaceae bacterium]|nr:histidine phosphatase family protein [Anaerolineaceae bacterium]
MLEAETPLLLPQPFKLYLVRHATPDRSRYDIPYHIPPGPNLTEQGQREAQQLGVFLRQVGIVHILASPLERTWRTASIAGALAGATVEVNIDLAEHRPEEKKEQVLQRVVCAFDLGGRLSAEQGNVALVSHGSPALILLKHLGLPEEIIERSRIYDARNLIPPAGVWEIESTPGQISLRLAFVPDGVKQPEVADAWVGAVGR